MTDNGPTVCVHGLGYIGLPTAAVLANSGYNVYGFDVDTELQSQLRSKDIPVDEQDLKRFIERALDDGLQIVNSPEPADFHLVCVPTPYDKKLNKANLSHIGAAIRTISNVLRAGDTVVVESTVPPGTTTQRVRSGIEESGLSVPDDVLLGYSPETVLPGNTLTELRENNRIVGTVDNSPPDRIVALYDSFTSGDIKTADATTAEFVKLLQNAYRDVNIAFANELAKLAREFDIDSRDAISMANSHPRVDILHPGPGVGGHCIPVDPLFLSHSSDVPMLIKTARKINDRMVVFVTELLTAALGALNEATVTILGVAYKGGVTDTRRSPSFALANQLKDEGIANVKLTDPHVQETDQDFEIHSLEAGLTESDAVVLVTDHPEYSALAPRMFTECMCGRVFVDTRGIINNDRWEAAGFDVHQV